MGFYLRHLWLWRPNRGVKLIFVLVDKQNIAYCCVKLTNIVYTEVIAWALGNNLLGSVAICDQY